MIYLFLLQIDTEHLFKFFIVSVIKPIRFSSKLHFSLENLFKIFLVSRQASPTEINFSRHQIIHRIKHPFNSHLNSNDQASYNHNNPFTSLSGWSKKKKSFSRNALQENAFHNMDNCYNVSSNNFKRNFIRFFLFPLTWLFLYVKKSSRWLLKNSSERSQRYLKGIFQLSFAIILRLINWLTLTKRITLPVSLFVRVAPFRDTNAIRARFARDWTIFDNVRIVHASPDRRWNGELILPSNRLFRAQNQSSTRYIIRSTMCCLRSSRKWCCLNGVKRNATWQYCRNRK